MHGIDEGPIYSNIGVTSSALAVQMFRNAQDLQQQNRNLWNLLPLVQDLIHYQPTTLCQGTIANLCFVSNWQTNSPELWG
ncbi:unnamed protein product [Sphagnum jensenii]|uniref:Uncharacterized protein n=1 Tax=Sphagnum jensenii TaxID=128206 RepID=A0ABP1BYC8_9BRYO